MRLFLLLIAILFSLSCSSSTEPIDKLVTQPFISIHTTLGVPVDSDSTDDYYIIRSQYVISYNKNRNIANWVSWELNSSWYGSVDRFDGNFITDTFLPEDFYRVKHNDYTNSGFDRGHMVRSEERTATEEDNKATFLMTNIIPQTPDLNRGVWLNLEYYCEDLCKNENKELFVIAGGIFHSSNSINGIVAIPDSCFKIVVILEAGQSLQDVNATTQIIAVVMPNIEGIQKDTWDKYVTTVDRIEASTGYDFLNAIPISTQKLIESQPTSLKCRKKSTKTKKQK